MRLLIGLIGVFIAGMGLILAAEPRLILDFMSRHKKRLWLHMVAVAVRLLIGYLLIEYADSTDHPLLVTAVGWFAIIAALFLLILGRENFKKLIRWAVELNDIQGRTGGVLAALFGAFLVYIAL
ncbi:hypothetical protein [Photobacterium galatheae]|uniref:Uncharacterized protein n=1 Tax=Photobacterium galatheae TaxID=1654360 RepID=A0A066S0D3_9GAMM|nr:hypothetical protein [Photobacterium galatheae]KDM93402.1 hypothetical protein EA58_00610 [Photobacterium galatheae]MCM0146982.1 hypothetical protein [Photobacterium galatheae]